MEHDVTVAGGTADIETGQLLIQNRRLCPVVLRNYKNGLMLEFGLLFIILS